MQVNSLSRLSNWHAEARGHRRSTRTNHREGGTSSPGFLGLTQICPTLAACEPALATCSPALAVRSAVRCAGRRGCDGDHIALDTFVRTSPNGGFNLGVANDCSWKVRNPRLDDPRLMPQSVGGARSVLGRRICGDRDRTGGRTRFWETNPARPVGCDHKSDQG